MAKSVKYKFFFSILFFELVIVILYAIANPPIYEGNPEEFWCCATDIPIGDYEPYFISSIHRPIDGHFIYTVSGYEHINYYQVDISEVVAIYPKILMQLEQVTQNDPEYSTPAITIYKQNRNDIEGNAVLFVEQILDLVEKHSSYAVEEDQGTNDYWNFIKKFWLINVFFEYCFFAGLTYFLSMPFLKNKGFSRFLIHFAYFPFILFIPFYLGYAKDTFSMGFFDSNSVHSIYPWVIHCFEDIMSHGKTDEWLFFNLPQVLIPVPYEMIYDYDWDWGHYVGLVSALVTGLSIHASTIFVLFIKRQFSQTKLKSKN